MNAIPLIGRILYAIPFLMFGIGHLTNPGMKAYAASMGVPAAEMLVPLTGLLIIAGGVAVILGKAAREAGACMAAWCLITAGVMHRFWDLPSTNDAETMAKMTQMVNFFKNMGMAGGGLFLFSFGSGPMSLDKKKRR